MKPALKRLILQEIYRVFDEWATQLDIVCHRGCAVCCTQNVTITSVEAELILRFTKENCMEQWLAAQLATGLPEHRPAVSTNEFARACLSNQDVDLAIEHYDRRCPFLHENVCSIYEARPFGCRCFASTTTCRPGSSATVPPHYMAATAAVSQIIEHLGQRDYWGNMLHVLYVLAQRPEYGISHLIADNAILEFARASCLTAEPLPGFLIGEDHYPLVAPLLEAIFITEVEGRKIEDLLNGS